MARNPYIEAISWIDGKDELGKPSWSHDRWEHADGFVSEWRWMTSEEFDEMMEAYKGSKMEKYKCYLCNGSELLSPLEESSGSIIVVSKDFMS